jgi:hypothetical protein
VCAKSIGVEGNKLAEFRQRGVSRSDRLRTPSFDQFKLGVVFRY